MGKAAKITLGVVGVIAVIGVASAVSGGGDSDTSKPATTTSQKPADAAPAKKPAASQADQFKAFVKAHGTATEKAAIEHVTKVQGAEEQNDLLDAPEVYTDYSGGLIGPHGSDGKLIASAFADWRHSKNGLVTVYDKGGELLANGKF